MFDYSLIHITINYVLLLSSSALKVENLDPKAVTQTKQTYGHIDAKRVVKPSDPSSNQPPQFEKQKGEASEKSTVSPSQGE